ncbi:unnamed protein product [Paramecium primaurelia]|uniref:Uncharacterized protein n=1 Tax=Paramecium primaurelia TaxID=5886 RepID=A0A8S1NM59_PARPR|nr:unnamed protein product [Paramecium primaurelia]
MDILFQKMVDNTMIMDQKKVYGKRQFKIKEGNIKKKEFSIVMYNYMRMDHMIEEEMGLKLVDRLK